MNYTQVMQWLEQYAIEIKIQDIGVNMRSKNRVILTYRSPIDGSKQVVGYRNVPGAVAKAHSNVASRKERITAAIADQN